MASRACCSGRKSNKSSSSTCVLHTHADNRTVYESGQDASFSQGHAAGHPGMLRSRKAGEPVASYVCCMLCVHQRDSDTTWHSLSDAKSSRVILVGGKPVKGGLAVPKEVKGQLLCFCLT